MWSEHAVAGACASILAWSGTVGSIGRHYSLGASMEERNRRVDGEDISGGRSLDT